MFPSYTDESGLTNVPTLCASSSADPPCYRTVNTLFPDNGGKKVTTDRGHGHAQATKWLLLSKRLTDTKLVTKTHRNDGVGQVLGSLGATANRTLYFEEITSQN